MRTNYLNIVADFFLTSEKTGNYTESFIMIVPPVDKNVYNPLTKKSVRLKDTEEYKWTMEFYNELKRLRKVALRMGRLSEEQIVYNLKNEAFKKLMNGTLKVEDITQHDMYMNLEQKGVDMRIGVDISSFF